MSLTKAEVDKVICLLPIEEAQAFRDFRAKLASLKPYEQTQLCLRKRDYLLNKQKKAASIAACYHTLFDQYIRSSDQAWKKFRTQTQEASRCLNALVTVINCWGEDIVNHYEFSLRNRGYCDKLRTAARLSEWKDTVVLLNVSISGRIRKRHLDKRAPNVRESNNPIENLDLLFVIKQTRAQSHADPPIALDGYGLDKYGLIVHEDFAETQVKSSRPLSPQPPSPSQWDGSTLIPSTSLAKQMPLPSPSKSSEPSPPIPSQHGNSNASTTNVQEQPTTPSMRSSSSLPGTSLSQSLLLPPATGDNGRGGTHSTANGPIVALRTSISSTSPSPLPSDVAASQPSPSLLSNTEIPSDADTVATICSSPPPPSPESTSTIDWEERSDPPTANNSTITISSLLAPLPTSSTQQSYYPPDTAQGSVSPSPARIVQGSTLLPLPLPEKVATSLLEGPEDYSSQDGNVHAINPAAIPYPYSAAPPLPSASLLHSQTKTLSIDSYPSSPLLVAPSTPKSAWLRDVPSSIHRLDEKGWLNDTIVNGYMHLITGNHDACFLSSHFLERFDPNSRWRFENGKYPLESEFVLMPINENSHWYLLVMYKRYFPATDYHERVVCFLDSLGATHSSSFNRWKTYLEARGDRLPVQIKEVQVPQQTNASDCGVFVLGFAETILQNVQGFIEAIDGGKELGWEFDASALRQRIKNILGAQARATEAEKILDVIAESPLLANAPESSTYMAFLLAISQQKSPPLGVASSYELSTSLTETSPLKRKLHGDDGRPAKRCAAETRNITMASTTAIVSKCEPSTFLENIPFPSAWPGLEDLVCLYTWAGEGSGGWYINTKEALEDCPIERGSNGFTIFNPRTSIQFQCGSAITLLFATRDLASNWRPMKVKNRHLKELFERMEEVGIGWNFEFLE
ncbi:hypothetical protein PG991_009072 [Apiospora marii]|uniref:Ubiquitin-like protease family profile domain-containing protein n=1 Tax=Apiospora marii TaxID=335849 RepID=A0ABR1RJM4_9PEZI